MKDRFCVRRIGAMTALAALWVVSPLAADEARPFRASGTDQITFFRGTVVEGIGSGVAKPGGGFTSVWSGEVIGHEAAGTEIWDFGGGDTLIFAWQSVFNKG